MLKESEIEKMANEIRDYLISKGLWIDARIYFNGKAYATDDRKGFFAYNDPEHLIVLEDEDPRDYFNYVNEDHILSMSFEGPLYEHLNYVGLSFEYDDKVNEELRYIFAKYGCYFELGNHWNLTAYKV